MEKSMDRSPEKATRRGTAAPTSFIPALIGTMLHILVNLLVEAANGIARWRVRLASRSEAMPGTVRPADNAFCPSRPSGRGRVALAAWPVNAARVRAPPSQDYPSRTVTKAL